MMGATITAMNKLVLPTHIFVLGSAGAGKSTIFKTLNEMHAVERAKLGISTPVHYNEVPYLFQQFKEEDKNEAAGLGRKWTEKVTVNLTTGEPLPEEKWYYRTIDLGLFRRLALDVSEEIQKKMAQQPNYENECTSIIEIVGGSSRPYREAFSLFPDPILASAAILFLDVRADVCIKRNSSRKEHTPLEQMRHFINNSDWKILSGGQSEGTIAVGNHKIPFISMDNNDTFANAGEKRDFTIMLSGVLCHLTELYQKYKMPFSVDEPELKAVSG